MIHSPQSSNPSPKTVHYSISQQASPQSAVQSSTPSPVYNLFTQQSPTTQEIQNELFSETESSLSPFQWDIDFVKHQKRRKGQQGQIKM